MLTTFIYKLITIYSMGGDKLQVGEYAVTPSHEKELLEFLKFNGFKHNSRFDNNPSDREYVIVVNVVNRFYFIADRFFIYPHLTEEEFYRKINHYPKEKIEFKKLFDEEGRLLYEGYTVNDHPYGLGRLYFDNGNVYQEGIFDIKGIRLGKEHYYSGQVKFEGSWNLTIGYGPNAPRTGNVYNENGEMTFSGKLEIKRGGVGWPMIKHPVGYRNIEERRPKIDYISYRSALEIGADAADVYDLIEEIQSYSMLELTSLRDELVFKIKESERKGSDEGRKWHLYLCEVCKRIYEEEENGNRD